MQPLILYAHQAGPNPKKVRMILEELGLPYEALLLEFPEMRKPPYLTINPNGRVPALVDPNTEITLWESGAIIEYLVEQYDVDKKISFNHSTPEYFQAKQWLHFQMSGQGPYFGQAAWFKVHHPEFIPSAYDRYASEIRRIAGVMNGVLKKRRYLVGERCSYADIAFVIWFEFVPWISGGTIDLKVEFPHLYGWLSRVEDRPGVKKVLDMTSALPERKT